MKFCSTNKDWSTGMSKSRSSPRWVTRWQAWLKIIQSCRACSTLLVLVVTQRMEQERNGTSKISSTPKNSLMIFYAAIVYIIIYCCIEYYEGILRGWRDFRRTDSLKKNQKNVIQTTILSHVGLDPLPKSTKTNMCMTECCFLVHLKLEHTNHKVVVHKEFQKFAHNWMLYFGPPVNGTCHTWSISLPSHKAWHSVLNRNTRNWEHNVSRRTIPWCVTVHLYQSTVTSKMQNLLHFWGRRDRHSILIRRGSILWCGLCKNLYDSSCFLSNHNNCFKNCTSVVSSSLITVLLQYLWSRGEYAAVSF